MQKIILTKKTLGVIIDRLAKVTSGIYSICEKENCKPTLRNSRWTPQIWPGGDNYLSCANVTPHWLLAENHPSFPNKNKVGFPMIHMAINAELAMCFYHGDVFYFKGNTLIINQTSGSSVDCADCQNIVIKISSIKSFKRMTLIEIQYDADIKEHAEDSADQMHELMAQTMAEDWHEFNERKISGY